MLLFYLAHTMCNLCVQYLFVSDIFIFIKHIIKPLSDPINLKIKETATKTEIKNNGKWKIKQWETTERKYYCIIKNGWLPAWRATEEKVTTSSWHLSVSCSHNNSSCLIEQGFSRHKEKEQKPPSAYSKRIIPADMWGTQHGVYGPDS